MNHMKHKKSPRQAVRPPSTADKQNYHEMPAKPATKYGEPVMGSGKVS